MLVGLSAADALGGWLEALALLSVARATAVGAKNTLAYLHVRSNAARIGHTPGRCCVLGPEISGCPRKVVPGLGKQVPEGQPQNPAESPAAPEIRLSNPRKFGPAGQISGGPSGMNNPDWNYSVCRDQQQLKLSWLC
jgi:hypothetical protein